MKLPDKVTTYRESVLSKLTPTLDTLSRKPMSPIELFQQTQQLYSNVEEFIDTLDCLYITGKISYLEDEGVIQYVE